MRSNPQYFFFSGVKLEDYSRDTGKHFHSAKCKSELVNACFSHSNPKKKYGLQDFTNKILTSGEIMVDFFKLLHLFYK